MASSEYEAVKVLYSVYPEIVPEPMAWGRYKEEDEVYFFVTRFYELSGDIPDVTDFPALLAEMHKRPEARSKTGEFGFPIITYGGRNPVKFPLSKTWEECLTKCFQEAFAAEEQTQGPDPELTRLREALFAKVIPRLIRPMETEGRHLEPILCHGDLWDGNASVDAATGEPKIFDPTPLWAHNEYEMAPWFIPRHRMIDAYINEYTKHYPVAQPAQDFEDRGLLYSLRFDIHASSIYPGNLRMRNTAMNNMRYLVGKYPDGYEGYARERGIHVETNKEAEARMAANMATVHANADSTLVAEEVAPLDPVSSGISTQGAVPQVVEAGT